MKYKLYTGDCVDVMKKHIADNSVQLTVTSPPYDNLRSYNGYSFDAKLVALELWRVTRPGGVVVWVVGDQTKNGSESGTSFRQALDFKEIGFNIHDTMIWKSAKPPLTHNRYEQAFEFMFVFSKGRPGAWNPIKEPCIGAGKNAQKRTFRQYGDKLLAMHKPGVIGDEKIKSNLWEIANSGVADRGDKFISEHPATFPEALARDHILSWSDPGDLVLDPLCGSGTTGKMALKNGRQFIGIDCSAEYIALSKKRIEGLL